MENDYWFIMGSDSQKPDTNLAFFKVLPKSENYERFKAGHGGEAYLRLGVYTAISLDNLGNNISNNNIIYCINLNDYF